LPSRLVGVDGRALHVAGWPSEGDDLAAEALSAAGVEALPAEGVGALPAGEVEASPPAGVDRV
jgi:hypothetical protein